MSDFSIGEHPVPPWFSETRREELLEYWADYLAKSTCPITMGIRTECELWEYPPEWYVRKAHGGYRIERADNKMQLTLEDKGPEDELSVKLAKWAEEGTPLTVEITHGP